MSAPVGRLGAVVFGLAIAVFAAYQQFKLPVVLPVLLERYGYDRVVAGSFMSIYALVGLLLSIPLGRMIARRGSLAPVLGALALVALGCIVTLWHPENGSIVLAARAVEGVAFAVFAIVGPVLANAHAPPRHHGLVVGLTAAWIPIGQILATAFAPIAFATVDWPLLWYVALAGTVGLAAWALRLDARTGVLGRPGQGGVAISVEAKIGARERRSIAITAGIFMLWSGQYFAYMTWLPQYLVEVHGLDPDNALLAYLVPVALVGALTVITGIALRAGFRPGPLMTGALVTQAGVWLLLPWTGGGASGVLSLIAYGLGAGVVPTCLFAMPSAVLGRRTGTAGAFGIVMTGRNLGVLVGPVLIAQTFKLTGDWHLAAPLFGTLTGVAVVLGARLAWRLRRLHGA